MSPPILDVYRKLFHLQDSLLGFAHFSWEEEFIIELLQLLKDLNVLEITLMWAATSNDSDHTFHEGCQPTCRKVFANFFNRYNMNGLIPKEKKV